MNIYLQRSASIQPRTGQILQKVKNEIINHVYVCHPAQFHHHFTSKLEPFDLVQKEVRGIKTGTCRLGALSADSSFPPRTGSRISDLTPRHITLSEARSRLYQRQSWPPNSHFSAFFKIYKIYKFFTILRRSNLKILLKFHKISSTIS